MKLPEQIRVRTSKVPGCDTQPGDTFGWFIIQPCTLCPTGLKIMATDGRSSDQEDTGFEHVSVSHITDEQLPTWAEMKTVRDLFWDEEMVVAYLPGPKENVDLAPVLHLWKWKLGEIVRPPRECV
jgi:hypothetical protein